MEEMFQERDLGCQWDHCCGLVWLGLEKSRSLGWGPRLGMRMAAES